MPSPDKLGRIVIILAAVAAVVQIIVLVTR
jgi:hypothetical protein